MTELSPLRTGLAQKCPACGKGKLFAGVLDIVSSCAHCNFDLSKSDPGDGPAFFVITIMGLLVVLLALWVNSAFHPALWVHALIWIPLTLGGSIFLLRIAKALLISYQFHLKAGLS